jgi:hypothetical protein
LRRNCLLKHVTEEKKGRIDEKGRRGRKNKQIPDDLNESKRYWKSKVEVLDRTVWKICFERGYGSDIRQTHDDDVKKRSLSSFRYYPNTWSEGLRKNTITLRIVQMQFSHLLDTILRFENIPAPCHAKKIICPLKSIG